MPHYKKPPTLQYASLTSLVSSVLKSAQKVLVSDDVNCNILREFVSEIPRRFADDYVAELLREMKQLATEDQTKRLLSIVLHPKCERLDMKTCILKKFKKIAVLANLDRLRELKYLRVIAMHGEFFMLTLDLHIHELHKLQVILLMSLCTSTVLRTVVNSCPLVIRFEAPFVQLEKGDFQLLSDLKNLQHVSVTSVKEKILPEDIAVLICRLPSLTFIHFYDIDKVIHVLKKWHQEGKAVPPFQVRDFGWGSRSNTELDTLCSYFPLIESIEIHDPADSITSLSKLRHLKRLRVLSIEADVVIQFTNNINCKIEELYLQDIFSFQDIFKSRNQIELESLKFLKLSECKEIDLIEMNSCLPNLETLELFSCVVISNNRYWVNNTSKAFSELKQLEIFDSVYESYDLQYLLTACKDISKLTLYGYYWPNSSRFIVTDDLWIHLTETNPMKKLRHLQITSDSLSRKVIPKMIESMDGLESLHLEGRQWSDELSQSEAQKLLELLSPYDVRISVTDLYREDANIFSYNIRE